MTWNNHVPQNFCDGAKHPLKRVRFDGGVFHQSIPFFATLRQDFRGEALSHPKLAPGKKAGMTALARAVLMVCSVDEEFESLLGVFCHRLGAHVARHAHALEGLGFRV